MGDEQMRSLTMGVLIASLFVLTSMTTTTAQPSPSEEPSTRTVEIPGAGAVVTLPREWRTWRRTEYDAMRRQTTGVWTTDLASGWTCHIRSNKDLVSADAAADEFASAMEFMPYELRERVSFDVPEGQVVSVTYGSTDQDPPRIYHDDVYVDGPEGVVLVNCNDAPIDHWLDVARSIAPLTADYSPEPFDPRVEVADHGFAVDFGVEWRVSSRTERLEARLWGTTVLSAQMPVIGGDGACDLCTIEDATGVPGLTGLTSVDDPKAAIKAAGKGTLHAREPTMKVIDLPSGPAIRAYWRQMASPTTAWIMSDDEHVVVLLCSSERPPKDRWRSIAKTIEFLPTEE